LAKRGALLAVGVMSLVPFSPGDSRTTRVVGMRDPVNGPAADSLQSKYPSSSKEFWLTADQFDLIQPGFHITVNSITIPDDGRPVVDLSFTDDANQPLDRLGQATLGALSVSMVLAWWDANLRQYTAYTTRVQTGGNGVMATQAAADSGGTWSDVAVGHSVYRFKTVVTSVPGVPYDSTKTHTLAIYATRDTSDVLGKDYYANVEQDFLPPDFRPGAAPVTETWDVIANAACNTCHNPLSAHGGSRQDVKLCVTCHSPQTTDPDTGNTVDFKVMVHKIHMGENLPSVVAGTPYVIIGNNGSVNDFSTVAFPQDIRNCTTCHGVAGTPTDTSQATNWNMFPSRAACASCHDDVNFVTGANHPAGPQADDSRCANCHPSQGNQEWDASVIGAHTVPYKSTQLKGLNAAIISVSNTHPGQHPTVKFRLTENDGTFVAPSAIGSNLKLLMGGPTTDYAIQPFREQADGATVTAGLASYTFTSAIPADAKGTWAFSIEARRTITLNPHPVDTDDVTEGAFNPIAYAAVSAGVPEPRRQVVDIGLCNTCHDRLAFHGTQRFNTQECVICHNPNGDDGEAPPESIDFKRMIHRIHTGTDLTHDFSISGDSFNGVLFPGDRRDCASCHLAGTWEIPDSARAGSLPTQTPRDWYTPQQPTAAACLGCHDTQAAAAHAFLNTPSSGEACVTCHGTDADFPVDKVHAR
jgi:OmcA/MtrC family decaheme c-type cytochrome